MESIVLLIGAFQTVLSDPMSLVFILIGVTAGIMVGCLPGLTATMGCALLVPFTFSMPPIQGLLMLMVFHYLKKVKQAKRLESQLLHLLSAGQSVH